MTDPIVAQKGPYIVELEAGTYWWCRCGKSSNQPFCDWSHDKTEFTPYQLVMDEPGLVALCGCKKTTDEPFCDGSHADISE